MTRYEEIKEALENMDTAEIVAVHNAYCENDDRMDDYIYFMEEFDEIVTGLKPWEIARSAYYGDFRPCAYYFRFDGNGNLTSFDCRAEENSGIFASNIARYIDDNEDDLGNEEIAEILEEEAV